MVHKTTTLPAGVPGVKSLKHINTWTFSQIRQYARVAHLVFRPFLEAPEEVAEKLLTRKVRHTMKLASTERGNLSVPLRRCAPRLLQLLELLAEAMQLLYKRTATPDQVRDMFSSLLRLGSNTFGKLLKAPVVHMTNHFAQVAHDYGCAVATATDSGECTNKVMKSMAMYVLFCCIYVCAIHTVCVCVWVGGWVGVGV